MSKRLKIEKSFEQKLQDGDLIDMKAAAAQTGYTEVHIRRLCRARPPKIAHIRRGGNQYYFTPASIAGVFKSVPASTHA